MNDALWATQTYLYTLPPERIAQAPLGRRDDSRLLVTRAGSAELEDAWTRDLPGIFARRFGLSRDRPLLLIGNDSAVVPARVPVRKATTGASCEVFLLDPLGEPPLACLFGNQKRLSPGDILLAQGRPVFRVHSLDPGTAEPLLPLQEILDVHGVTPLPPYIDPSLYPEAGHRERYRTVYGRDGGSVAASTAGFHLSTQTLERLGEGNVEFRTLTLHIGAGTFAPVKEDDLTRHAMHSERYRLGMALWERILRATEERTPIVFVGTTSLRAVTSFVRLHLSAPGDDPAACLPALRRADADAWHTTRLFLYPTGEDPSPPPLGDGLLTNFHAPGSTLVMLIASLLGRHAWRQSYEHALQGPYRFLSYGDAQLLVWDRS